jgi:2-oxoglutarate ferredoxin oxidoreductase subunit gamma
MKQIRLAGVGGQGIVLLGAILGEAANIANQYVGLSATYGSEARGTPTTSDVVISDAWLDYPKVEVPDILVAFFQAGYEKNLAIMNERGLILYDPDLLKRVASSLVPHTEIPATKLAMEKLSSTIASNMVMLGALVCLTGVISREAATKAMELSVSSRFLQTNLAAFNIGYEYAESLK